MLRKLMFGMIAGLAVLAVGVSRAQAQDTAADWTPPSRDMPRMPRIADLQGNWRAAVGPWFDGVEQVTGASPAALRVLGEPAPGSDRTQIVRFTSGPLPVAVWTDLGGDERADRIELYRGGGMIIQVIDANYDGAADVMRVYDASGALVREERM